MIIGAGLPRTGTESLKRALEILDYGPCYHMVDVIAHPAHLAVWESASADTDWDQLFAGYRAAVDFPAMYHWQQLAARYPQARVILGVRDAAAWYASITATVLAAVKIIPDDDPVTARRRRLVRRDLVEGLFAGRADDRAFMLKLFDSHRDRVCAALPATRLLLFDVRTGWAPLCTFLQRPVPAQPFPHVNARADFRQRFID